MDPKELRGLYEAYAEICAPQEVDEAVKGETTERRKDLAAERRAGHRPLPAKEGEKYAKYKMAQMDYTKRKRMGEEVEEIGEETDDPIDVDFKPQRLPSGKTPKLPPHHTAAIASALKMRARAKERTKNEEVELDQMIETLTEMGYSKKDAYTIVSHLTLDEAQHARENPEKFEREARKNETHQQKLERRVNDARKTNPSLDKMMKAYGF